MVFLSRTQVITAIGAVLLALYVLDLVRRRRLSEEYSVLWVISTTLVAVLGFSTPFLTWISRELGMVGENSTVFAVGLAFTMAMLLHLSTRVSRLGQENQALARELALLRQRFEDPQPAADPGAGSAGAGRAGRG
jgi:hypothetical protein